MKILKNYKNSRSKFSKKRFAVDITEEEKAKDDEILFK